MIRSIPEVAYGWQCFLCLICIKQWIKQDRVTQSSSYPSVSVSLIFCSPQSNPITTYVVPTYSIHIQTWVCWEYDPQKVPRNTRKLIKIWIYLWTHIQSLHQSLSNVAYNTHISQKMPQGNTEAYYDLPLISNYCIVKILMKVGSVDNNVCAIWQVGIFPSRDRRKTSLENRSIGPLSSYLQLLHCQVSLWFSQTF